MSIIHIYIYIISWGYGVPCIYIKSVNKSILVLDVVVQMIPASLVVPGPFNHGGGRTLILLTRGVLSHSGVPCMNCLYVLTTFPLTPPMPVVFFEPRTREREL